MAKEYFLTASKASRKADRVSKDTQSGGKSNDGLINGDNTNTITPVDNIDNIEIVADNVANAATNAESIDTESTNTDNINNAEIENDKPEDVVMSDDNEDNAAMSNKNNHEATSGDDNRRMSHQVRLVQMMCPHLFFMVEKQQTQVKLKPQESIDPLGLNP